MMLGTIAALLARIQVGDVETLASADFVTGVFSIAGTPVAAEDVIDKPELIGEDGLAIPDDTEDGTVAIIGPLLAALVSANWTIVLEYEDTGSSFAVLPLVITTADPLTMEYEYIQIERSNAGGGRRMRAYDSDGGFRFIEDTDSHAAGVHRIALTRTDERIAMSVDGDPVLSDENGSFSHTMVLAAFGGIPTDWSLTECYIRRFDVYPVQDDSVLPTLST